MGAFAALGPEAECVKLTAEKDWLNQDYALLKGDIREVEQIRRSVYSLLREQTQRAQPARE